MEGGGVKMGRASWQEGSGDLSCISSPGNSMECPDCGRIVIVIRKCWLEQGRGKPYLPSQPPAAPGWENDLGLDIYASLSNMAVLCLKMN